MLLYCLVVCAFLNLLTTDNINQIWEELLMMLFDPLKPLPHKRITLRGHERIGQYAIKGPRGKIPKRGPPWRKWEELSYRNGLHHAVYSNSGDIYVGDWQRGLREGKGHISSEKGWRYEGDWWKGMRHGHGVLSKRKDDHCDKTHYTGGWLLGKRDGQGRQIYEDGTVYIGKWSKGKRDGHGRIWYKNGDFYEGDWCDDKPHGYGIFVYANGCRFEGEWMNGLKHGYGRFYHLLTGQIQDGLWIEGVSKCSGITEIPYRQNTPRPNPYPLHKLELENSHNVQMSAEEHAISNFLNSLDAPINLEEQK